MSRKPSRDFFALQQLALSPSSSVLGRVDSRELARVSILTKCDHPQVSWIDPQHLNLKEMRFVA